MNIWQEMTKRLLTNRNRNGACPGRASAVWIRRILEAKKRDRLALRFFGDFFFLGALFLFFLLELVVDEFEDGDLGAVTDANAGGDDARVTSSAIRKLRSDVGEKLLRH